MSRCAAILASVLGLGACVVPGTEDGPDTVRRRMFRLPPNARVGMFVTWTLVDSDPDPRDVVEETTACVAADSRGLVIEWRERRRDGTAEVTAARFRPDGRLVGVWRGPPGSVGKPLRILDGNEDLEEAMAESERRAAKHGVSAKSNREESGREVLETPAGRIPCAFRRMRVTVLFSQAQSTTWWSLKPLPLTSFVRMVSEFGGRRTETVLAGYGETGAKPTLRIPRPR